MGPLLVITTWLVWGKHGIGIFESILGAVQVRAIFICPAAHRGIHGPTARTSLGSLRVEKLRLHSGPPGSESPLASFSCDSQVHWSLRSPAIADNVQSLVQSHAFTLALKSSCDSVQWFYWWAAPRHLLHCLNFLRGDLGYQWLSLMWLRITWEFYPKYRYLVSTVEQIKWNLWQWVWSLCFLGEKTIFGFRWLL